MSEGVVKTLTNPYVLAAGAALGLVLMLSGRAGAATGSNTGQAASSPFTTAVVEYNKAALDNVTQQAQIAGQVAIARTQADMTSQVATLQTIQNIAASRNDVMKQAIISNQGILNSQITGNTAIITDLADNAARLGMAQQQTTQTKITSDAAIEIARQQAKAAEHAANMGFASNLLGSVAKIAAAPFTGGASLLIPTGFDSGGNPTGSSVPPPDLQGLY